VAKRTASAKKQARAGARRTVRNRGVKSEVKTLVVKARKSLGEASGATAGSGSGTASGTASERLAVAVAAVRSLDRAAAKGILHPNNASRRKSRLARQMVKLAAAAAAEKAPPTKGKAAKAEPEARPSRARRLLGRS
jgi:small subunit ribosomal protein S20